MTKQDKKSQVEPENKEISTLKTQIEELTSGWQRTQADFDNFRRQVQVERLKFSQLAKAEVMTEILPVLDNFQLAAKHVPEELKENSWVTGVRQIESQLETILYSAGLVRIDTICQDFDPSLHEAIDYVESKETEDTVLEEVAAGYTFDGIVLRPAKVKVAKKGE